jgi:hypothetical protein
LIERLGLFLSVNLFAFSLADLAKKDGPMDEINGKKLNS